MDTAAVIGLVLAALLLGALFPVLMQLRATLRAAQRTFEAAERTIADINQMTPAVKATLKSVEQVSQSLAPGQTASGVLSTVSQLLPVALAVFRALTGQDEDEAPPASAADATATHPPQRESA